MLVYRTLSGNGSVLAFCEAVFLAVSIRDAILVYRTLSGNGSVLAFCEAVFLAVSIRDAILVYRTLSGNGSGLAFFEAVFWRSAFAMRCWFTALSVIMGQCWLSMRLFFGDQNSRRDVGLPHSQW